MFGCCYQYDVIEETKSRPNYDRFYLFSKDIVVIIASYLPIYKLTDWHGKRFASVAAVCNPRIGTYLSDNSRCLEKNSVWSGISTNESLIDLIRQNPKRINWKMLSMNPAAMDLLLANKSKINWEWLSMNSAAIDLLLANPSKINWNMFSANTNLKAIAYLRSNPSKISWTWLSRNENAMDLLLANPEKIDWKTLSRNPHPIAIQLLRTYPSKIHLENLCKNKSPLAVELILERLDRVKLKWLSANPNIFEPKPNERLIKCLNDLQF